MRPAARISGSSAAAYLASQYVAAGLLELLRVTVVPTVLGAGLPLFAEPSRR